MVKANFHGGGPFGVPSGQVTVEIPDGVSKTFNAGDVKNSLTNSGWARGGPDGCGYGAFPSEHDDGPGSLYGSYPHERRDKFRVG